MSAGTHRPCDCPSCRARAERERDDAFWAVVAQLTPAGQELAKIETKEGE